MNNAQFAIVVTISSLSLITSGLTLAAMLKGAKKMETEVTEVREKTNSAIRRLKTTLEDLSI